MLASQIARKFCIQFRGADIWWQNLLVGGISTHPPTYTDNLIEPKTPSEDERSLSVWETTRKNARKAVQENLPRENQEKKGFSHQQIVIKTFTIDWNASIALVYVA